MDDIKLIRYDEVPFHGDAIPSALVEKNGKQAIVVHPKATCERLGVNWPTQYRNITDHPVWAKGIVKMTIPSPRGLQETVMLELRFWLLWLANIDPRRVNEEAAPLLMAYQVEAADVLEAHFLKTLAAPARPASTLDVLEMTLKGLREQEERMVRLEAGQQQAEAEQQKHARHLTALHHRVNTLDHVDIEGDDRQRLDAMINKYTHDNGLQYGQGWNAFDKAWNTAFGANLTALRKNYAKKHGLKKVPTRPEYLELVGQLPDALRIADKMLTNRQAG